MSRQDVSDELLTLLGAGHETTASSLGLGIREAAPPPRNPGRTGQGGRRGRQRIPAGHDPGVAAGANGDRLRRTARQGAEVRRRRMGYSARLHDSGEHRRPARERRSSSRTPSGSIRTASSTPGRPRSRGCRSAAEPAAASAPPSRTPRWTSCCELCCSTSESRPTTLRREGALPGHRLYAQGRRPRGGAPQVSAA